MSVCVFFFKCSTGLDLSHYGVQRIYRYTKTPSRLVLSGQNLISSLCSSSVRKQHLVLSEYQRSEIFKFIHLLFYYCTLFYTIVHYHTLLYTIIHYRTLSYTIVHYRTLSHTIVDYRKLSHTFVCILSYTIKRYRTILYTIVHHRLLLYTFMNCQTLLKICLKVNFSLTLEKCAKESVMYSFFHVNLFRNKIVLGFERTTRIMNMRKNTRRRRETRANYNVNLHNEFPTARS